MMDFFYFMNNACKKTASLLKRLMVMYNKEFCVIFSEIKKTIKASYVELRLHGL